MSLLLEHDTVINTDTAKKKVACETVADEIRAEKDVKKGESLAKVSMCFLLCSFVALSIGLGQGIKYRWFQKYW